MIKSKKAFEKYSHDIRYGGEIDNLSNPYSIRNPFGLDFELKKIKSIFELLNKNKFKLKNKKVLEIGSHYGFICQFLNYFVEQKNSITGIDIIEKHVKKARSLNSNINYYVHDIANDIPEKDESFDLILVLYTLHCCNEKDEIKITKNIEKKLKKGGFLVFFDLYTPEKFKFVYNVLFAAKNFRFYKNDCFGKYNNKKMKLLFSNAKIIDSMSLIDETPYSFTPRLIKLIKLILNRSNEVNHKYYMALLQKI